MSDRLVDFPISVTTLAEYFDRDVRTIQLWVEKWIEKYNLIKNNRNEYMFAACCRCRFKDLEKENEILSKAGDEKLYAHQITGQIIKNKKAEIDWRHSIYQLVNKRSILLLWSAQNNTIKSLLITGENDLKLKLSEDVNEEQKIKTITETFKQLRVDISEITIEDLIDNEDELFPEEKELEEKE